MEPWGKIQCYILALSPATGPIHRINFFFIFQRKQNAFQPDRACVARRWEIWKELEYEH